MDTVFLKFTDQAQALAAFTDCGISNYSGRLPTLADGMAIDVIGIITRVVDDSNPTAQVLETLVGWHVNVIGTVPAALLSYSIEPVNPVRIFLG
jgi:hypothetical protein